MSTGEKIANPRRLLHSERQLAQAQRNLARNRKGSKNRGKARLTGARLQAKIADQRADGLHQLTTCLIRENQTMCVESLAVKNMVRNPTLATSISDAGWGEWVRRLEYKAAWYGRTLIKIDRWYPRSQRCHACGHINAPLTLDMHAPVALPEPGLRYPGCGIRTAVSSMAGIATPRQTFWPWDSR